MGGSLILVGIGLIVFHIWFSFEMFGFYSFQKNLKNQLHETIEKVYQNKSKSLKSKVIFYFWYVYKEKILIYIGIVLLTTGLAINILK